MRLRVVVLLTQKYQNLDILKYKNIRSLSIFNDDVGRHVEFDL
jgi:hypothetical protein